ncbi:MAG: TonB family protein [candidate division Zixibacteria bacterium]|nr:TonB family protein [candidate division Zixibacteria bacterium]
MRRALGTIALTSPVAGTGPGHVLYGALEIKRCYQRNMAAGVLLAATVHLLIVGGVRMYRHRQPAAIVEQEIIIIPGITQLAPPPRLTTALPQALVSNPEVPMPEFGIPQPVPDAEAPVQVHFPTRDELAEINPTLPPTTGETPGVFVIPGPVGNDDEYFPKSGEFVPVEMLPVRIDKTTLEYPETAALTGTEGVVVVEALVDREGKVREAKVLQSSGSNVGFEQAAVDFSLKHLYKPAIQNGRPVAVRIAFKVEFRLSR